jgi:hypothetical protein
MVCLDEAMCARVRPGLNRAKQALSVATGFNFKGLERKQEWRQVRIDDFQLPNGMSR